MSCSPSCQYFPNPINSLNYTVDEFGVKHCSHKFFCEYNSKQITSWDIDCPRETNKRRKHGKHNRKQRKVY